MGMVALDRDTLPGAIAALLRLNNYTVEENVLVHGAQIDLVARSISDPFANPLYIEATVEYVNNEKYSKDLTKFALVQRIDPGCICLCLSTKGFTADVKERASITGIRTLTYDQLFQSFEKFGLYLDRITKSSGSITFDSTYEEPSLEDAVGCDQATRWLTDWRDKTDERAQWLIILGEYGTGKTALTRTLQYRWLRDYQNLPSNPIPFRIELRDFVRQFDARTLVHHFLDHNGLGHLSIEFVFYLIRNRRIILILDGYDEMAQFLNVRERRACLSSLAELASEGARGILTSRPNYFTEAEELRVFEALYSSLQTGKYYLSGMDKKYLQQEARIDTLVEKYVLNRYERRLRDLTPTQTESLVRRKLAGDQDGQDVVLALLRRVFRDLPGGDRYSLSGKPVIISYLLELIDELKQERPEEIGALTEWEVYKLILDRLMLRDHQRTPSMLPQQRRRCLQRLAVRISQRDAPLANEGIFMEVIDEEFRNELRVLTAEDRLVRRTELFENLRSSATLTRSSDTKAEGWTFSHNSLREYLCCEYMVDRLNARGTNGPPVPISNAMRSFIASIDRIVLDFQITALQAIWDNRRANSGIGRYLTLYWDAFRNHLTGDGLGIRSVLERLGGGSLQIDSIQLSNVSFDGEHDNDILTRVQICNSDLSEITFDNVDISNGDFHASLMDNVSFKVCRLNHCNFDECFLFDCEFIDCELLGASFRNIDPDCSIYVYETGGRLKLEGNDAIGYLRHRGALTNHVDDFFVYQFHSKFGIVQKICERLAGQRNSQLRGLTQRGEAHQDPVYAREFVDFLRSRGLIEIDRHELVSATSDGRSVFSDLCDFRKLSPIIREHLDDYRR